MKWYFAANEYGFDNIFPLIKVAVNSAIDNTGLSPYCLYNGFDPQHIQSLEQLGVTVVKHESSFKEDLKIGYGKNYDKFKGHWLRCDIPLIENDDVVLYTDVDVMFLSCPIEAAKGQLLPQYIAAAPEISENNYNYFNSGVMVMNLSALRGVIDEFHASIKKRLTGEFKYPSHDQQSFNDFFLNDVDWIDNIYNWKPYWGVNENAVIIHFHGPKPDRVELFVKGDFDNTREGLIRLWKKSPSGYSYYNPIFYSYLRGSLQ